MAQYTSTRPQSPKPTGFPFHPSLTRQKSSQSPLSPPATAASTSSSTDLQSQATPRAFTDFTPTATPMKLEDGRGGGVVGSPTGLAGAGGGGSKSFKVLSRPAQPTRINTSDLGTSTVGRAGAGGNMQSFTDAMNQASAVPRGGEAIPGALPSADYSFGRSPPLHETIGHAGANVLSPTSTVPGPSPVFLSNPVSTSTSTGSVPGLTAAHSRSNTGESSANGTGRISLMATPTSEKRDFGFGIGLDTAAVRAALGKEMQAEEMLEGEGSGAEGSTGSQTPRRGSVFGIGALALGTFSRKVSENDSGSSGKESSTPHKMSGPGMQRRGSGQKGLAIKTAGIVPSAMGPPAAPNTMPATPRRPSLLTQQILSSPAVPLSTPTTASSSMSHDHVPSGYSFGRKSSLKDRMKGTLSVLGSSGAESPSQARASYANWREASLPDRDFKGRTRVQHLEFDDRSMLSPTDTGSRARGLPPIAGESENLRDTSRFGSTGSTGRDRGRARQHNRSQTYAEGSSQDELGASGFGNWGRSGNLSLGTDDDDAVIETQDISFAKDAKTGRKMVNQYVILHEIGRGQHGQVRLGQDISMPSPEVSRMTSANASTHSVLGISPSEFGGLPTPSGSRSQGPTPPSTDTLSPISGQYPSNAGYWAIKMVDRQPKKKLPGVKKMNSGYPGLGGSSREGNVTNEKLRKEIAILKKCRHPNVVRLREVIDAPASRKIYLVLEYCEGGEVKWKTDAGHPLLTVEQSRVIFRDIVLGLEYLHHQGIIHRDIKPANLLYTADGAVKISDFGVSHYSHVLRGQNSQEADSPDEEDLGFTNEHDLAKTAGSPAFFAPELCYSDFALPSSEASSPIAEHSDFRPDFRLDSQSKAGNRLSVASGHSAAPTLKANKDRPPITEAIDVWAIGVTLYCFLFGRVPFEANSEYHLLSIIPTQDFNVPEVMGSDSLVTGGRTGYRKGTRDGVLCVEACEAMDLLDKLLQKDPTKRITLSDVKSHPFVLRGLNDKAAWLAKTNPAEGAFVTVSNDEVAAAVTNSGSFRDRVKKSMKHISSRLFGSNSSSKSRSRSHSIVNANDGLASQMVSPLEGTSSIPPSPHIRAHPKHATGGAHRSASGQSVINSDDGHYRPPSPRPGGLVRRLSMLGTKATRSISPLPPPGRVLHVDSNFSLLNDEFDNLGRSMSDRSTTSSAGHLPMARMGPVRRQSTHLAPPVAGDIDNRGANVRKTLSTSTSAEHLSSLGTEELSDMGSPRRQRAMSNASSAGGPGSSGFHTKFANLFRGPSQSQSHKGSSASSIVSSAPGAPDIDNDLKNALAKIPIHPTLNQGDLRSRKSTDTFASRSALSSQAPSPAGSFRHLPPIPPIIAEDEVAPPAEVDLTHEQMDWDGDLSSDGEDDYGNPVITTYNRPSEARQWDRVPDSVDDLQEGTWKLDGSGWHGQSSQGALKEGLGLSGTTSYPLSGVPSTIKEATESELLAQQSSPRSTNPPLRSPERHPAQLPPSSPPGSPPASPTVPIFSEDRRRSFSRVRASPLRGGLVNHPERARSPLGTRAPRSPVIFGGFLNMPEDPEDNDEDEDEEGGLAIDVGKRGRRISKPVTPLVNHVKLPE